VPDLRSMRDCGFFMAGGALSGSAPMRLTGGTNCAAGMARGPMPTPGSPSDLAKRLCEVGNKVVLVLHPDAEADQTFGHAHALADGRIDAGVRGARRVARQGLGAAEAHCELEDLESVQQAEGARPRLRR
jgi:hypothetical protein